MSANNLPNPIESAKKIPVQLAKVIKVQENSNHELPDNLAKYHELSKNRLFLNEIIAVTPSPLTIVGEAPKGLIRGAMPSAAMLWFWNNYLCPLYTLTFYWKAHRQSELISLRLFLPAESNEFQSFLNKKTQFILIRNKKPLIALSIHANDLDDEFWELLDRGQPNENVKDLIGAKILVNWQIEKPHTPVQLLQHGWAKRLETEVGLAVRFYRDEKIARQWNEELPKVKKSAFADYFSINEGMLPWLYNSMQGKYTDPNLDVIKIINLPNEELVDTPIHHDFVNRIMLCAWFSSSLTSCGLKILSIGFDKGLSTVDIDVEALSHNVNHFWNRLAFVFPMYYKQLFGSRSCPMDQDQFFSSVPSYEGNINEGWNFVNDLLAEATSLKKWTIPFGAYVQLNLGHIKAVKLFEIGEDVACVFVNHEKEYIFVWVNPLEKIFAFTHHIDNLFHAGIEAAKRGNLDQIQDERYRKDIFERFQLSIAIPLVAIIRDFWVVEERMKVFGAARPIRESEQISSDKKELRIVYLPRIRYVGDIKRLAEPLHLKTRRPHFVTGHLRRAMEANEKQIFLARKYGIVVPEGFTFVRPHKRGDKAQETIYRSRSALQCIRALRPIPAIDEKDAWFAFELNVTDWLKKNGFEVDHLAGNRNGDGGVDIQASKGEEVLLVQCKYWHKVKIGPAVIRELIGTLHTFPQGSKGVLITSTELTKGAQKLAINNAIEYIQNIDFDKEINIKL